MKKINLVKVIDTKESVLWIEDFSGEVFELRSKMYEGANHAEAKHPCTAKREYKVSEAEMSLVCSRLCKAALRLQQSEQRGEEVESKADVRSRSAL